MMWKEFPHFLPSSNSMYATYSCPDPQSLNRYSYVKNDPVNFVDPSGLLLEEPSRIIINTYDQRWWDFMHRPWDGWGGFGDTGRRGPPALDPDGGGGNAAPGPQNSQDKLPFDTCNEFVNWLSKLVTDVLIGAHVARQGRGATAAALGTALADTAYFGYERHIHNGDAGFKSELVDAGEGSPEGRQGAGVYGHILFGAGSTLVGKVDPLGSAAFHANRFKDWAQAASGSSQYPSERAGNIAGQAVGNHIWDYLGGKPSQADFNNQVKGVLCAK